METTTTIPTIIHHVMILEHGIMGTPKELGYVHEALQREFEAANSEDATTRFLVHSATCNEADSLDGIEAGGLRLAEEVKELLQDYASNEILPMMQRTTSTDNHAFALSFLGFSLGGMYSRYALPFIEWNVSVAIDSDGDESGNDNIAPSTTTTIPVLPNLFATMATPHLGIKRMTYWKLPRCLEPVVAWYLGQSGRDLFRRPQPQQSRSTTQNGDGDSQPSGDTDMYEDLIQQMNMDPYFLQPLSKFNKRIAFANAFSTDFCVSTATAAFLSDHDERHDGDDTHSDEKMPSAHFHVDDGDDGHDDHQNAEEDKQSLYSSIRFETSQSFSRKFTSESFDDISTNQQLEILPMDGSCQRKALLDRTPSNKSNASNKSAKSIESETVADMAMNLNSLGWTKVFVDSRPHLPALWRRAKPQSMMVQNENGEKVYSSATLKRRLSGAFDFNVLPVGHSFMVASTKNKMSTWLYKDGRNFVDQVIAKELVRETLRFDATTEESAAVDVESLYNTNL